MINKEKLYPVIQSNQTDAAKRGISKIIETHKENCFATKGFFTSHR